MKLPSFHRLIKSDHGAFINFYATIIHNLQGKRKCTNKIIHVTVKGRNHIFNAYPYLKLKVVSHNFCQQQ